MKIDEIRRFPVKSLLGESLTTAQIQHRGLEGDRLWALRNSDGKFGSGKTTRRFQRMDGLFDLKARYDGEVPIVVMPDGIEYRGDEDTVHVALSRWAGFPLTLAREDAISHFDEGPVSLITTASLRALSKRLGHPIDSRRFRANLLVDAESEGFTEEEWVGREIRIGSTVVLRVVAPLPRCVMVGLPQEDLPEDTDILRVLAQEHNTYFGVFAKVEVGGNVVVGDTVQVC